MGGTNVTVEPFGALPDGTAVERWVLDSGAVRVAVLTYGGILQQILLPDRHARVADVVLGFDDLAGYLGPHPYLGALVGRFAGRIANGRFPLNDREYALDRTDGAHHLHGGVEGFDKRLWAARPIPDGTRPDGTRPDGTEPDGTGRGGGVRLRLVSPDGDQGYPGRLEVTVEYTLDREELRIAYGATNVERPGGPATVVNLTNHVYLNLGGHDAGGVGGHVVTVPADEVAAADAGLIPTGAMLAVAGTPFDLRVPRRLDAGWDSDHDQIVNAGGYDQSWVLPPAPDASAAAAAPAARVVEPVSGRVLEVRTDQTTLHLYTGNMMTEVPGGKGGRTYHRRDGFCVETQHLPDSPNHPAFPTTVLAPGETFRSTTTFRFGTSADPDGRG